MAQDMGPKISRRAFVGAVGAGAAAATTSSLG